MVQRRFHYDQAFERYLRAKAIPYIAVDEAKRAIGRDLPGIDTHGLETSSNLAHGSEGLPRGRGVNKAEGKSGRLSGGLSGGGGECLKSFDFVVYSQSGSNLLIDVKGRKYGGQGPGSLQNWVTASDVRGLGQWEAIFGSGFEAVFVFLYWCEAQPPGALFEETFKSTQRCYAVRAIRLADYRVFMRQRSRRWDTVSIPTRCFEALARPMREML